MTSSPTQAVLTAWPVPRVPAAPRPAVTVAGSDPLPMPTDAWGLREALSAIDEARLALPLGPGPAEVVSSLTTVVARVGSHAVKVYPPGTDPAHLGRITAALGTSTTALVPLAEPVVTSWGVVAVSPWLASARPVDWAETGALLRRFHEEHAAADVAPWDPLRRIVTQVVGLPDEDAVVLLDARETLLRELGGLTSPLGDGVVHGDVSPSNVLRGRDGARLIDLDFVARAPREYDLSSAARRADTGEIDAATYREFCEAYGADVRSWEGRPVLDAVAQLGGVAFRLWDDRRRGKPLTWLDETVAAWRHPL